MCQKAQMEIVKKQPRKDVEFQAFNESNAEVFEIINDFIVFKYFKLEDIVFLFSENFINQDISGVGFNLFTEKKFLKNVAISDWLLNDQKAYTKMKEFNEKFFDILSKAFKSYYKTATNGGKWDKKDFLPLVLFYPLAVIYGIARNDVKIDFIFDFLANANGEMLLDNRTRFFFFSLLAIPSAVSLFTFKLIAEEHADYMKQVEKFDINTIFSGYEVKDAVNSTNAILNEIFGDQEKINYDEFTRKVRENRNLQSITSQNGIRYYISQHGID